MSSSPGPGKPPEELRLEGSIRALDDAFLSYWYALLRRVEAGDRWALWRLVNTVFVGTEKISEIALGVAEQRLVLRSIAANCEAWPILCSPAQGLHPPAEKLFECLQLGHALPFRLDPARRYVRDALGRLTEKLIQEIAGQGWIYIHFAALPNRQEELASLPVWAVDAAKLVQTKPVDVKAWTRVVIEVFDARFCEQKSLRLLVHRFGQERKKEGKAALGARWRQRSFLHSKIEQKTVTSFINVSCALVAAVARRTCFAAPWRVEKKNTPPFRTWKKVEWARRFN